MSSCTTSHVTLRQLEALAAVADAGGFTAAAELLGRSQPTVSKEIQTLERTLRHELVTRSGRNPRLSEEGLRLLPRARRVLSEVAELELTARTPQRRQTITVRVACTPSVSNRLLPELLQEIERSMSQLDVTVKEVETGGVETLVDQGEADLGLCHHPRHTRLTRTDVLGSDELVLIGRDDVLSGVPSPDDLSALASIPLLLWPRDNHPEYFDSLVSLCRTRGLSPLLLIGADRLSGARRYLLTQGRAVSIVPLDAAQALESGLARLRLGDDARAPLGAVLPLSPTRVVLDVVDLARELHEAARTRPERGASTAERRRRR